MQVPYLISGNGNISIIKNGKPYGATPQHSNYTKILEKVKAEDFTDIELLFDVPKAISTFSSGNITVEYGQVKYKGQVLHNVVTEKILEFTNKGFPAKPLIAFLERLMKNPSSQSIEHLYLFLEKWQLTINQDGRFVAYKSVRSDFKDWHTGKVDNSIGAVIPRMERNQVDDNRSVACSKGYHAGSFEYANDFHGMEESILLAVLIDPADVVSVPSDCEDQKIRCCFYEPMQIMEQRVSRLPQEDFLYDEDELDLDDDDYDSEVEYDELDDDEDDSELDDGNGVDCGCGWGRDCPSY